MTNLFATDPNITIPEIISPSTNTETTASKITPEYAPQSTIVKDLMKDPTVIEMSKKVDPTDIVGLNELGKEPADAMSKITGSLLDQFTVADTIGSTQILTTLTKIAKQIDIKELKVEESKGLKALFVKAENVLKSRVAKYQSLNGEINALFLALKGYETTINARINDLKQLSAANSAYATNLNQYIALIYILRNNLAFQISNTEIAANSGDQDAQLKLPELQQAAKVLERRAFDLEQAKAMATITAPQITQTQDNNFKLIEQFHAAFIVNIPTLKSSLVQAVNALQQNYAQQGLNASKTAMDALMRKNVDQLAVNNTFIATSADTPTVSVETMQYVLDVISKSVVETKQLEENNAKEREIARVKMENIATTAKNLALNITETTNV